MRVRWVWAFLDLPEQGFEKLSSTGARHCDSRLAEAR